MIYTLLQTVQLILSALDSDEINSITDTTESYQIALMAQSIFYDICVELNLPSQHTILQLQPSINPNQPTVMTIPQTNIRKLEWLQYDNIDPTQGDITSNWVPVTQLDFNSFIERQNGYRNDTTGNVLQYTFTGNNGSSFNTNCRKDNFPLYWCTYDDNTVLIDSFRSDIESTLQASKTMASGYQYQIFLLQDSFIPQLEPQQFSYFNNKLKARAFNELKQTVNQEATAEARRQKIVQQNRKFRVQDIPPVFRVARYGRNSSYGVLESLLEKYGRNST